MTTKYDLESLKKASEIIRKDLSRHYTIDEIAAMVALSPSRLKNGFKELFGMGMYQYLEEQRLEKGRDLIENSVKTIKEISSEVGYGYKNNFSTAFKKKFGRTPVEWRNKK